MCVKAPWPTMSPIAHSRSPALIRSSTSTVRADGSRPTVSSPMPSRLGMRPAATRSLSKRQLLVVHRDGELAIGVRHLRDGDAGQHLDALAPEHVGDQGSGLRLDRAEDVRTHLEHRDAYAEPGQRLGQLGPDRPAADDPERAGQGVDPQHLAVGPERRVGQAVDRRGRGAGPGVEHHAPGRLEGLATDLDDPGTGQPAVAPHEPGPRVLEPLDGDRVVPVVGGLVADAGMHRSPVGADVRRAGQPVDPAPLRQRVGRPDDHLAGDAAEVGALPTHQPLVHPDHREPGPGQRRRRRLATRTEADHHHVT